jgi:hypothetical protein
MWLDPAAVVECGFTVVTTAQAFLLRKDETDGLSVKYNCTPDDCENELKEKSYGVLSLIAHQVTGLGLRVIPDEPHHANIKDIPHKHDDAERAMLLAGQLSTLAVTIREGLRKKNPG